jgi:hypothetical protein
MERAQPTAASPVKLSRSGVSRQTATSIAMTSAIAASLPQAGGA